MEQGKQSPIAWVIVFISCPCHLIILLLLTAGTAFGAFLKVYLIPLAVAFGIIFVISLMKAIKSSSLDTHK